MLADARDVERVRPGDLADALGEFADPAGPESYVLSGVMRVVDGAVEYGAILTRARDQSVQWSYAVSRPLSEATRPRAVDEVSRGIALVLGSPRGPLHRSARQWLSTHPNFSAVATPYLCRIAFEAYRDTADPDDAQSARRCFASLPAEEQMTPASLATNATLAMDTAVPAKVAEDGDILVFDPESKLFGVYRADGKARTIFRPKDPAEVYWDNQRGALQ